MYNIKLFDLHSDYETYINSEDKILPNLSYCKDQNDTHLNEIDNRVIATFNITDTTINTNILYFGVKSKIVKIEIDDVELPTVTEKYKFDTTGIHTIKYTLKDPTVLEKEFFVDCPKLKEVILPNTIITINDSAFNSCNQLTKVTIPNSVTSIGNSVFLHCTSLTNITIPNSVTSIGNNVFQNCTSLTNIRIPNSVTSIGNDAFSQCTQLSLIVIGKNVTSIGDSCFRRCENLINIYSLATTAPTIQTNTFYNVKTTGGTLYVPAGSTGYDVWMSRDYFLGQYNWTLVEQQ